MWTSPGIVGEVRTGLFMNAMSNKSTAKEREVQPRAGKNFLSSQYLLSSSITGMDKTWPSRCYWHAVGYTDWDQSNNIWIAKVCTPVLCVEMLLSDLEAFHVAWSKKKKRQDTHLRAPTNKCFQNFCSHPVKFF